MPDADATTEDRSIDPLAGVVMYGVIEAHPKAMTIEQVCRYAKRKLKKRRRKGTLVI